MKRVNNAKNKSESTRLFFVFFLGMFAGFMAPVLESMGIFRALSVFLVWLSFYFFYKSPDKHS